MSVDTLAPAPAAPCADRPGGHRRGADWRGAGNARQDEGTMGRGAFRSSSAAMDGRR